MYRMQLRQLIHCDATGLQGGPWEEAWNAGEQRVLRCGEKLDEQHHRQHRANDTHSDDKISTRVGSKTQMLQGVANDGPSRSTDGEQRAKGSELGHQMHRAPPQHVGACRKHRRSAVQKRWPAAILSA